MSLVLRERKGKKLKGANEKGEKEKKRKGDNNEKIVCIEVTGIAKEKLIGKLPRKRSFRT